MRREWGAALRKLAPAARNRPQPPAASAAAGAWAGTCCAPAPERRAAAPPFPRPQVGLIASLRNEHQHRIVEQALTALGCMEHRGACSADDVSGDGAGIMTKIPWGLLKAEMPQLKEETTG